METVLTKNVEQAAEFLRSGEVVAFPTETVYGLGARISSDQAIAQIYTAKGRPSDNPLIAHVAHQDHIEALVSHFPPQAQALAQAFWPGPLTLVLPKSSHISPLASASLPTLGVRWPAHPLAQQLITLVGEAVVAPSANRSGFPSPTTAQHVLEDLAGRIPLVLDGGPCQVGIESTVVSLVDPQAPLLLRPGSLTLESLEAVLGVQITLPQTTDLERPASPGMKYRHYAPAAPVFLVASPQELPADFSAESDIFLQNIQEATLYALVREADRQKKARIFLLDTPWLRLQAGLWNRVEKMVRNA